MSPKRRPADFRGNIQVSFALSCARSGQYSSLDTCPASPWWPGPRGLEPLRDRRQYVRSGI